jgi:hypothetical protein
MDGTGKCKQPSTPPSKQNSTFKHRNGEILNLETSADPKQKQDSLHITDKI